MLCAHRPPNYRRPAVPCRCLLSCVCSDCCLLWGASGTIVSAAASAMASALTSVALGDVHEETQREQLRWIDELLQQTIDNGILRLGIHLQHHVTAFPSYIGFARSVRDLRITNNVRLQSVSVSFSHSPSSRLLWLCACLSCVLASACLQPPLIYASVCTLLWLSHCVPLGLFPAPRPTPPTSSPRDGQDRPLSPTEEQRGAIQQKEGPDPTPNPNSQQVIAQWQGGGERGLRLTKSVYT